MHPGFVDAEEKPVLASLCQRAIQFGLLPAKHCAPLVVASLRHFFVHRQEICEQVVARAELETRKYVALEQLISKRVRVHMRRPTSRRELEHVRKLAFQSVCGVAERQLDVSFTDAGEVHELDGLHLIDLCEELLRCGFRRNRKNLDEHIAQVFWPRVSVRHKHQRSAAMLPVENAKSRLVTPALHRLWRHDLCVDRKLRLDEFKARDHSGKNLFAPARGYFVLADRCCSVGLKCAVFLPYG
mmetsp:Transcript_12213/g.32901  ORF Transcript_12213/g.32901 Transcript_12213/m.32901 type:complete len:242 (+) Transcript_12213:460-1185(+)